MGHVGLVRLAPEQLPRIEEVGLDATTAIFASGIVSIAVLIFGLAPALRISGEGVVESIQRGSRGGVGDKAGRRTRASCWWRRSPFR